jgi:hypothetical protein
MILAPFSHMEPVSVPGRAGKIGSLTLVLDGNNPRFPWAPSTTMATHTLTGTTETSGFARDEQQPSSTDRRFVTRPPAKPHEPGIFASHGEPRKRLALADLHGC